MNGHDRFAAFRGDFPAETLDARRVAGLLDAPGCTRRQIIDAASVPVNKLAGLLGCPAGGQSPFAIARERMFERQVTANDMGPLLALVRDRLGVPVTAAREKDLSADQVRMQFGRGDVEFRAQLTRQYLDGMLAEKAGAINLLRHPVLTLTVGAEPVHVEPDAIIFASGDRLKPVEIRSYPCIDGVADPNAVGVTARQIAVYILAIREAAAALGHDPQRIDTRGLLVLPENFSLHATGAPVDVAPQTRRLARALAAFPDLDSLAALLTDGAALPALPGRHAGQATWQAATEQAQHVVSLLPSRFGDGCLSCALFTFCRSEQDSFATVARVGTAAANLCGDVGAVDQALALAHGQVMPAGEAERALAADLSRAARVAAWAGQGPA